MAKRAVETQQSHMFMHPSFEFMKLWLHITCAITSAFNSLHVRCDVTKSAAAKIKKLFARKIDKNGTNVSTAIVIKTIEKYI